MTKFTTGVKRYEQKIKDVSHLFAFELVNDYSAQSNIDSNKLDKHQIQMQLISQFLFLHPSYKRLVEFAAETTLANYVKYYRHNFFKNQLNEEIKLEAMKLVDKEFDYNEAEVLNDTFYFFLNLEKSILNQLNKNVLIEISKRITKKLTTVCTENSLKYRNKFNLI
jgi:hypothetical protein